MEVGYIMKLMLQKILGVGIIILCLLVFYIAGKGVDARDKDGSIVLLLAPLGLYLIFTRKLVDGVGEIR